MKTKTIKLEQGGVMTICYRRLYGQINFDLWKSMLNLKPEALQKVEDLWFDCAAPYLEVGCFCGGFSIGCGCLARLPIAEIDSIADKLQKILEDPQNLDTREESRKRFEQRFQR